MLNTAHDTKSQSIRALIRDALQVSKVFMHVGEDEGPIQSLMALARANHTHKLPRLSWSKVRKERYPGT